MTNPNYGDRATKGELALTLRWRRREEEGLEGVEGWTKRVRVRVGR